MSKDITRSTVNSEQYAAPELAKSGFDLSYKRYASFILGRLHVGAFQWIMPGDKISGSSSINGTFKRIVTPLMTPVRAMSYQIYMPLRGIDRTFMKGMTPTKLNAMSANWNVPTVNTRKLVDDIFSSYYASAPVLADQKGAIADAFEWIKNNSTATINDYMTGLTQGESVDDLLYNGFTNRNGDTCAGLISAPVYSLTDPSGAFFQMAKSLYLDDALIDIANNITNNLGDADHPISGAMLMTDFLNLYINCLLTPFVGRYSYYGEFKYNFLRPSDIYRLSHTVGTISSFAWSDFLTNFDDTPLSEYPLRIMYSIWYERFRNVDLEPVSSTLPDWNDFGSTSIFDLANGGNLCYLIYRIRSWEKDMFVSAQIDDLSRHVYAPISSSAVPSAAYHTADSNNHDTNVPSSVDPANDYSEGSQKPAQYIISWRDQADGIDKKVTCPVPTNVNDILSASDLQFADVYGLDLNTLRQSQMLERYLKRNYLFGDEYKDRLLAHYNSRLSDMRINRPEILGQSLSDYDMSQEVSNVSTDETKVGDRTATATISLSGDNYTTYAEEFGLLVTVVSFMPRPMYDGVSPQLLCTKQSHFPLPEFAANNEEFGRKMEIAASGLASDINGTDADIKYMFGRYPAYHAWRSRVDEVGGMFLDELQDSSFRRFWGMFNADTTPKLNYYFIHCRPNLGMFADTNVYSTQLYGDIVNECYVERVLPTPVEVI